MSLNSAVNPATLWLVGTPLGNPGDLSPRARQCLEEVEAVLAEDTRRAGLACRRWGARPHRLISLHEHNEDRKRALVLDMLRRGQSLALISDAGMPVLADPGYLLVRACREADLPVSVIPGPSAVLTALAGSGIPPQPFVFLGFLPRGYADREQRLEPYARLSVTLICFERKDRLADTLAVAHRLLGPREVCLARELTKTHERYWNFRLENPPDCTHVLGEVTVVIGPPEQRIRSLRSDVEAVIAEELPFGGAPREVARRVQSRVTGWTSGEIYSMLPRTSDKHRRKQKSGVQGEG
jgi:16S rRNA (cytidine1402-2'-O)-methyltransferase